MQLENPFQALFEKLDTIEQALQELKAIQVVQPESPESDLLSISEASELLRLSKNTIYFLSSQSKIPVTKKGKRLYFSKRELLDWIKSGRRATTDELNSVAFSHVQKRKAFRI